MSQKKKRLFHISVCWYNELIYKNMHVLSVIDEILKFEILR